MKKIILFFTILLLSNQITIAQCLGKRKVTEFYPKKSEVTYTYPNTTKFQDGTTGRQQEIRSDITRAWWEIWFCGNKPEVFADYWGCEECAEQTTFIALKKGGTSVVLFNYGETTYAIFDAQKLANHHKYLEKLFPEIYSVDNTNKIRENKINYFEYLQKQFKSKKVVALTTKDLELYFK